MAIKYGTGRKQKYGIGLLTCHMKLCSSSLAVDLGPGNAGIGDSCALDDLPMFSRLSKDKKPPNLVRLRSHRRDLNVKCARCLAVCEQKNSDCILK